MKQYILFLLVSAFLFSCESKKEEKKTVVKPLAIKELQIVENEEELIYKIDDNTVRLYSDTLHIESPFIYSFDGTIEGKKIQIHLSNNLSSEYGGYYKSGSVYIDGEEEIFACSFEKDKTGNFYEAIVSGYYASEERDKNICNLKLYNLLSDDMFIECLYNKKTYKLYPSAEFPSYKCYDAIDYTLYDCRKQYAKEESMREFSEYRDYTFLAEIFSTNEKYKKIEAELKYLISDENDGKNYKKWQHKFLIEKAVEEGDFENSESLLIVNPIFIDSNIFVTSDFSYGYFGGAHGMMTTDYKNYDVNTGQLIKLENIINTSSKDFIEFYNEEVKSTYGDSILDKEVSMSDKFFILPTGIVFSYAPYELLGFAAGEPHVFFSYEELKPFMKKNIILEKYYM